MYVEKLSGSTANPNLQAAFNTPNVSQMASPLSFGVQVSPSLHALTPFTLQASNGRLHVGNIEIALVQVFSNRVCTSNSNASDGRSTHPSSVTHILPSGQLPTWHSVPDNVAPVTQPTQCPEALT